MTNSKMLRLKPFLKKTCENLKSDTTMLTQTLEQALEQYPERSEEMLSILTRLYEDEKRLSGEVYFKLKSQIEPLIDETLVVYPPQNPPVAETQAVSDSLRGQSLNTHNNYSSSTQSGSFMEPTPLRHPEQWEENDEDVLKPDSVIRDNYRLIEIIGKGGMGVVWKAIDLLQDEAELRDPFVAIKFLNADFKQHPDALKVLVREFKKCQKLNHTNIVNVYDLSRIGSTVFMVMEFLKGLSLKTVIQNHPNGIALEKAEPLIRKMSHALAHAHQEGIVHLDFKPSNVLYDENARNLKVIDFGIARSDSDGELTRFLYKELGGLTKLYASCEMLAKMKSDPRDDIYALACVTYELLCGKHPFDKKAANIAQLEGLTPKPIKSLKRKQNQAFMHALAFERKNRTATVEDFLAELFRKSVLWF